MYSCDFIDTAGDRGHLQRDVKSYCHDDFSRTLQGRAITRYASFVAFNKAYLMDINKCVHADHDIQGTTVNWVGGESRLACCVCDNYQQARAAPRFLLQPMQYSPVCGHTGSQCFDEGDWGNWAYRCFRGTRVSKYPGINIPTNNITGIHKAT